MDSKETSLAGTPIDPCKCFDLSVGTFLFDFNIEYMCANRSWYYVKNDEDILKRSDARERGAQGQTIVQNATKSCNIKRSTNGPPRR